MKENDQENNYCFEDRDSFTLAERDIAHRQSEATDDSQATPQISTFAAISELIWGPPTITSAAESTKKSKAYDYKLQIGAEGDASLEESKYPFTPSSAGRKEHVAYLEGKSTSSKVRKPKGPSQVLHQEGCRS